MGARNSHSTGIQGRGCFNYKWHIWYADINSTEYPTTTQALPKHRDMICMRYRLWFCWCFFFSGIESVTAGRGVPGTLWVTFRLKRCAWSLLKGVTKRTSSVVWGWAMPISKDIFQSMKVTELITWFRKTPLVLPGSAGEDYWNVTVHEYAVFIRFYKFLLGAQYRMCSVWPVVLNLWALLSVKI